jgi:glycine cleavage system pyridoxal-binding protein P
MLQAIFEYQTSICNLTGMDATNASVYDGATALTESLIMAKAISRKNKFIILQPINPEYHQVIDTYALSSDYIVDYKSIDILNKWILIGIGAGLFKILISLVKFKILTI